MKAILRNYRCSSKKANLVAKLVRNMRANEAVDILAFTPKKTAEAMKRLLQSAIANAQENNAQKSEDLVIKEIIVTEGTTMKRFIPVSRGRAHRIRKRTCHITLKLENKPAEKVEKKSSSTKTAKTNA